MKIVDCIPSTQRKMKRSKHTIKRIAEIQAFLDSGADMALLEYRQWPLDVAKERPAYESALHMLTLDRKRENPPKDMPKCRIQQAQGGIYITKKL